MEYKKNLFIQNEIKRVSAMVYLYQCSYETQSKVLARSEKTSLSEK